MKLKLILFSFLFVSCLFSQSDTTGIDSDSCEWYIPNVITYNCGSIYNWQEDYELFVYSSCPIKNYHIIVYNKWGEIMYESTDILKYWYAEGSPEGSYSYQIKGVYENNSLFNFNGIVYKLN